MLVHLHVKNLALIEDIEVEFGSGLNILTGETGAGKSILLGSMQLILGSRSARDMIRYRCVLCACGASLSGRKSNVQKKLFVNLVNPARKMVRSF